MTKQPQHIYYFRRAMVVSITLCALSILTGYAFPKPIRLAMITPPIIGVTLFCYRYQKGQL